MKKILTYTFFLISVTLSFAQVQTPTLLWEYSHKVNTTQTATDNNGNLFVAGNFAGANIDIDISSAVNIVSSTDNGFSTYTPDAYLAKYGVAGNLLWKIVLASAIDESFTDVTTDAAGNAYVYGNTTNSVNINPLGTAFYLPVSGNFLAKYSSNGQLLWAFHSDIDVPDLSFAVNYKQFLTIDQSSQSLLVAGFINGSVDVDPSPTASYILSDTTMANYRKTFVITRYDANGNFVAAADFQGAISAGPVGGSNMEFSRIKTDNTGNVWLLCQVNQYTIDIDPSGAIQNVNGTGGNNTGCVAKFNSNFQLQIVKTLTESRFSAMEFDSQNNLLLAGDFATAIDFDFGAGSALLDAGPSTMDFFVAKYDVNLNYTWSFTHGNTQFNFSRIFAVDVDLNDNIIVNGDYDLNSSQSDFDPSVAGTYTVNGYGSFIAKYSPSKSLLAIGIIPQLNNYANFMHYNKVLNKIDYFGSYGGGGLTNTYDFDMTLGTHNETSTPSASTNFVARYNLNCENNNTDTLYQTICFNDTLHTGNQSFHTSGIYPVIYQSISNCDSIVKLNLNVIPHDVAVSHTICSTQGYNFNGNLLTSSGVYTATLTNVLNCDSVVMLTLTVVSLDTTVTLTDNVLSTAESFIGYQWYNCTSGNIINGANSQNYSVNLTADYSVILTKSGCVDTTNCVHVVFSGGTSALPQNLWGSQMNTLNVKAYSVDKNGNSYLVGYQLPQIDVDPGTGTTIPPNIINGLYILKYDASGNFVWARWIEPPSAGTGTFTVNNVNTDTSGALIISGGFKGSFDVDASAVSHDVYSAAFSSTSSDMFMMKYNANGSFEWFNQFGEGLTNYVTDTYIDANNDIYAVGFVDDYLDYDPGAGTVYLDTYNGFIAKYDENGNYLSGIGMDDNVTVNQIAVDTTNNHIFVSGDFTQTKDIAPGLGNDFYIGDSYFGTSSSYVTELDASYNFVNGMGILSDNIVRITDMVADNNGRLNITGTYNTANNNFNFNGSPYSVTPHAGGGDCFLAQYNTSLELNWVRRIANSFVDFPKQIVVDSVNNMFVLGTYKMDIDVDGTAGIFNLPGVFASNDNYMASYNENGYFNWGIKLGSASNDEAIGIGMDNAGNIYACLNASNTVIYNKDAQGNNQEFGITTGAGAYFAKYGYCNVIDTNIALNGNYLSSAAQNVTYQWYNCATSQAIPSATLSSFYPTNSGNYGVLLDNGTCQIMSECLNFVITSINEKYTLDFVIYPNPNNGNFNIQFGENKLVEKTITVSISNLLGQVLFTKTLSSNANPEMEITTENLVKGVYIVTLSQSNKNIGQRKLVIE